MWSVFNVNFHCAAAVCAIEKFWQGLNTIDAMKNWIFYVCVFVCTCVSGCLIIQAMPKNCNFWRNRKILERMKFCTRDYCRKVESNAICFWFSIWNSLNSLSRSLALKFLFLFSRLFPQSILDYDQHVTNWLEQKQKQKQKRNLI